MKSCTLSECMRNLSTKDEIEEQSICGRWGVNEFEEEKKRRGWWLEMLPVCQRLTALASGINSNKAENRARATAHTHARTHSHTHGHTGILSQLFFSVNPPTLQQHVTAPLFLPSSLPPVLPLRQTLFILPADSGNEHNEDLSHKKGGFSVGWRDCGQTRGRERERERDTLHLKGR